MFHTIFFLKYDLFTVYSVKLNPREPYTTARWTVGVYVRIQAIVAGTVGCLASSKNALIKGVKSALQKKKK